MKLIFQTILALIVTLLLALVIERLFVHRAIMPAKSMMPTLALGTPVKINTLYYFVTSPRRWEIIAYEPAAETNLLFLGRIIALPGETVTFTNGAVFVNGIPLNRIPECPGVISATNYTPALIPAGPMPRDSYFILVDNPGSTDSRHLGPIPRERIRGRVQ